jgi:hypothetical protein
MTRENDTAAACYPDMATHQNVCVGRERKRKIKYKVCERRMNTQKREQTEE